MESSKNIALLFPGQGSQSIGMAQPFLHLPWAKQMLEEAEEILQTNLGQLMHSGPAETLTLTQNAQPALLLAGLLAWEYLRRQHPEITQQIAATAGHSLGEYTAVTAAGAFTFPQAMQLVKVRSQAMSKAQGGGMLAVLGLTPEQAEQAASQSHTTLANDNAPGQIILSGAAENLEAASQAAKALGAKRVLPLNVSGAFHTPLMAQAAQAVQAQLAQTPPQNLTIPCIMNITAQPTQAAPQVAQNLIAQTTGRVRWRQSMEYLATQNITQLIELGSGKVLTGLASRCHPNLQCSALDSPASIDAWLQTHFK
ncbi:MAG: [acyl-carrier-protein] S-malonyltransferase [Proteobacteria bacterium]|nr:[acyl-carrier-protein] S-malonyltransferase [Pseudomonadota bacterium]NBX86819.1 [acyl-carrier-protein] S-malonyltransferase [Pseudomonadota bacterium]